jgi:hypothetical protein
MGPAEPDGSGAITGARECFHILHSDLSIQRVGLGQSAAPVCNRYVVCVPP